MVFSTQWNVIFSSHSCSLLPSLSAASANICNVVLMRYGELEEGIDVLDGDGNLVGSSKIAARHVGCPGAWELGGGGWQGQQQGGCLFLLNVCIPWGLLCLAPLLCPLDLSSSPPISASPGLKVWPSHSCPVDVPASFQLPSPHRCETAPSQDLASLIC